MQYNGAQASTFVRVVSWFVLCLVNSIISLQYAVVCLCVSN